MLIMYLLGMLFHSAKVSSLFFALELKSCSALCAQYAERDLKKTSNTLTETLIGLFLMA